MNFWVENQVLLTNNELILQHGIHTKVGDHLRRRNSVPTVLKSRGCNLVNNNGRWWEGPKSTLGIRNSHASILRPVQHRPFMSLCLYLLTYLLTPWCRVLLEKLTGLQLVKKFPAFHGTRRCITALTSVHHLSLSWASPIQSTVFLHHPNSRFEKFLFLFIPLQFMSKKKLFYVGKSI